MKLGRFFSLVILCISNGVVTIFGLVILSFGVLQAINADRIAGKLPTAPIGYVLGCICGIIIIILTAFGWFAAAKRHQVSLIIYAVLIFSMAVAQLLICVSLFATLPRMTTNAQPKFVKSLEEHYAEYGNDTDVRNVIDNMHHSYKCCGPEKPIKIADEFPLSCCPRLNKGKCTKPYPRGCSESVTGYTEIKIKDCLILIVCAGAFQVIAGTSAFSLYKSLKHDHH